MPDERERERKRSMPDRRNYISVEVEFFQHPETLRLGETLAYRVLAAWAYCRQYRTDGFITTEAGTRLVPRKADRVKLERHYWIAVRGGWNAKDFLRHQPSRADLEAASVAAKRAAETRWHPSGRTEQLPLGPSGPHSAAHADRMPSDSDTDTDTSSRRSERPRTPMPARARAASGAGAFAPEDAGVRALRPAATIFDRAFDRVLERHGLTRAELETAATATTARPRVDN